MCPKLYNVLRHSRVTRYKRIRNKVNRTTEQKIGRNKLCREKKTAFKKGLFISSERQNIMSMKQEQVDMKKEHSEYTES